MAEQFAAPPINPLVSITPLSTPAANRDATGIPAQLANASPGTTIEGFVINRDANANPIVRTAVGDILVKSDVFIKTGSEVVFRVDTTQPGHARIVSIDGLEPQVYAAQNTRGITTDTVNASLPPGAASSRAVQPQPLQAVLVNAGAPALANFASEIPIPAALASLQQGATLRVKVLQVSLPEILHPTAASPATPAPAGSAGTASAPPNPATSAAPPAAAPPAAALPGSPAPALPELALGEHAMAQAKTAKIALEQVQALTQPAKEAAPAQAGPSAEKLPVLRGESMRTPADGPGLLAQVIGHEKSGATILQTRVGTLKTHLPQPLPVGTSLRVELAVEAATPSAAAPVGGELGKVSTLAQHWPALDETLAWAAVNAPELSRQLMAQVPGIGPKLTSGLLFFMAAVKGGDIRQWLGNRALQALEAKSPGLAGRLQQDMAQLQHMLMDSPLQQWNSIMLPMLFGEHLEHARLFLRRDPEQGTAGDGKKGKDHRFILEVDLSDLGEVQFDGFVRHAAQAKQFDLIVRMSRSFPPELSEQIRATFENAMQSTGMKGYLGFQVGNQHFVRPMASNTPEAGSGDAQPILA